jgi:hypothetical protein
MIFNQVSKHYLFEVSNSAHLISQRFDISAQSHLLLFLEDSDFSHIEMLIEQHNNNVMLLIKKLQTYYQTLIHNNPTRSLVSLYFDYQKDNCELLSYNQQLYVQFNKKQLPMQQHYTLPISEINAIICTHPLNHEDSFSFPMLVTTKNYQQQYPQTSKKIHFLINFDLLKDATSLIKTSIPARRDEISTFEKSLETLLLTKEKYQFQLDNILISAHELLLNAYEYGALRLSGKMKQELIEANQLSSFCLKEEKKHQKKIEVSLLQLGTNALLFIVSDAEEGFDIDKIIYHHNTNAHTYHGRGLLMVKTLSDGLFFNHHGSTISALFLLDEYPID